MKRIFCFVLAMIMAFMLCSCSKPAQVTVTAEPSVSPAQETPIATAPPVSDRELVLVQPQDVVVKEHGSCVFVALHREVLEGTWHFVTPSGDMDVVSTDLNIYLPHVGVYCDNFTEMLLTNIVMQLDGCSVYCEFEDGTRTRNAKISIDPYL